MAEKETFKTTKQKTKLFCVTAIALALIALEKKHFYIRR